LREERVDVSGVPGPYDSAARTQVRTPLITEKEFKIKDTSEGWKGAMEAAMILSPFGPEEALGALFGRGASIARHHAWPKYLGGAAKQELAPLTRNLHNAFHAGLDKIAPRRWGAQYYANLPAAAKAEVLRDLANYTLAFDAKYGTEIYKYLLKAGLPAP